jgi:hypothetical protein
MDQIFPRPRFVLVVLVKPGFKFLVPDSLVIRGKGLACPGGIRREEGGGGRKKEEERGRREEGRGRREERREEEELT